MDELVVVSICLLFNALFAAYEMAFVSVPKSELRGLARDGNTNAKALLSLREKPERALSVIQVGITLVSVIGAAVGGAGASETLEPYFVQNFNFSDRAAELFSVALVVVPITYLSVVVGELVPKTLALRNPTKIVLAGAKTLFVADRALYPIISLLEWSTKKVLKIFFRRAKAPLPSHESAIEIDSFSPVHQKFMLNLADIEKKRIRDILLPWPQVVSVQSTSSVADVTQLVVSSGHTRLPVEKNGHVSGLLHTKEFITLKESGESNWQTLIRPISMVQPSDSALGVMRLLQCKRSHMAVVIASTGERLGIVTMEDILEEVVGEISDEDDDGRVRRVYAAKVKSKIFHRME